MLRLKTLKFKNIGRFIEQQEISFDKLGNLVQIDAQNNLTGGSSGSGKSTLFNALDWLLGLSDLSTSVLQSRLTKESISVEGHFDWDSKEVCIHRARKLSVTIDGVETTGSAKLAEEQIDLILGMPRNLFRQLLHRRQGESGFFLAMGPSQMNSFLTDCLNLAPVRSKIDVIDQKLKDLAQAKDKTESDLQASQAALEAIKSAKTSLGQEPTTNVTETTVSMLKAKLELAEATLEALKGANKLEREALQAQKPILNTTPYDRTQINALETEIKALEVQINVELDKERARQVRVNADISAIKLEANNKISVLRLEHGNKAAELKAAIAKCDNAILIGRASKEIAVTLAGKVKALRSGICHTCEQSWQTLQAKQEEEKILAELVKHKSNIEASAKAASEIEEYKAQVSVLTDQLNIDISAINTFTNAQTAGLIEQAKPQTTPEFLALKEKTLDLSKQKSAEFVKEDEYNIQENAKNQIMLEAFFLEQKALADKHQKALDSVNKEMNEAKNQYEQNAQALAAHLISLKRYQDASDSLKSKEEELYTKNVQLHTKSVQLKEDLEIAEEAKRCLKSYLSCSFDDSLDSVSESATRILRAVPTMANATIRLESTKETGSGAIKEVVNAVLDNDGEIGVPIKSLSGGERSAVDLAIDLSVCEMIQEKANKGIDIAILDEPFNGFDSVGIENALEMLKTFSSDKKILLVEHDGVAKEFIQDRITVIRDGETSYIK